MKKVVLLLWMISLLWMPAAYAAGIPAQQGLVVDEAGLLTSREAAALTNAAAGDRYTFHILIIESLKGAGSADYASDVYDSWGLSTRDILLLISSEDQQVELNFNNPGLQASLNSWSQRQGGAAGSAAIKALLDTYFIPYARDGDFAGGISSLMEATEALGTGSAGNGGSGTSAGTTGTESAASPGFPLLRVVPFLIGAALILGLLFLVITGIRRRKQLEEQQELLGDLLVQANRAIESLKPFQGIVQGKTGEMVEGISGRLSNHLIQISTLRNEGGAGVKPAFYRLAALRTAAEKLRETNLNFRTALLEEEKQIEVISEADRNVKQRITELKSDAPELNQQLLSAVQEKGYELQEIAEDLKELAEETAKADQLELFDPIAAQDITEDAQEKQEQIEKNLKDVDAYDDKVNDFPEVLASTRAKIAAMIEQNSLHNMKVRPYDNLEQASAEAAALEAPLRAGDMDEVRKIGARVDSLLEDAVAMTERQALLRQNNRRDLETLRLGWSQLEQRREGLRARVLESGTRFVKQHVSEASDHLESWSTRLREGAAEVPQIESWSSDARGEYENAHSALDRLLSLQQEAGQQFNGISESLDALNERLDKVIRLFSEGQSRIDTAEQLLQSRGLSTRSRFQLSSLPEFGELQQRLSAAPYNLDELEAVARSYQAQIDAFVDEATRLVRQREEEERQAQLARMREQQRREQARKRMSSGPPSTGGFGGGRSSGGSSWGGGRSGGNSSGGSKW
ncbi:TPM domain-containing protein [Paenibacillus sp. BR2-3]|uniref:TPM domain-containing protein n=1 Tax=Paenibacillus sp. BR2-3 TaxID=3048494 RepID=UPI0039775432